MTTYTQEQEDYMLVTDVRGEALEILDATESGKVDDHARECALQLACYIGITPEMLAERLASY